MKRITVFSTLSTLFIICFFIIIATGDGCDDCYSVSMMMIKFALSGVVLFVGSIYFTWIYLKNEKIIFFIETIPLLKTNNAVTGLPFSCEGKVNQNETELLQSPYTNMPCIYYHCITEQYVREGESSKWKIIENLLSYIPFYISDDRGKLKVDLTNLDNDLSGYSIDRNNPSVPDPENSEIDCTAVLKHQLVSSNVRRSEFILPPNVNIFAHGYIFAVDGELVLREHPQHPLIISQKTKDVYIEEFYKGKNLVYLVHLLITIGYTISLLSLNYFLRLHPLVFYMMMASGNGLLTISILFTMYNRLVTLSQRARFALYDIDVELKRRFDLIPMIVEVIKAYSQHEQELQQFIAQMRSQIILLKELPLVSKPDYLPLTSIIEKYPDLKASNNFKHLMDSLVDTEERIAYSRAFYNRNVRKLNTLVTQFPFILISKFFNIPTMNYVSIKSDESNHQDAQS